MLLFLLIWKIVEYYFLTVPVRKRQAVKLHNSMNINFGLWLRINNDDNDDLFFKRLHPPKGVRCYFIKIKRYAAFQILKEMVLYKDEKIWHYIFKSMALYKD